MCGETCILVAVSQILLADISEQISMTKKFSSKIQSLSPAVRNLLLLYRLVSTIKQF